MAGNYADIRREYELGQLTEQQLTECPMSLFEQWFSVVEKHQTADPTAMVLGTVDEAGIPSQRIVLLKAATTEGFTFFTNLSSKKAQAITKNPNVSLHFPWHFMERQVIVQGRARLLDRHAVESYFVSRPRQSQLGAWASHQSQPVDSREVLEQAYVSAGERFPDDVPVPDFWGGYCVVPERIEFWQGGAKRLHDRFEYVRNDANGWCTQRLMP